MLVKPKQPRLLLTAEAPSEIFAVCLACARPFHAYIRTSEKDAIVRLNRNFRLHLRLAHSQVPSKTESQLISEPHL